LFALSPESKEEEKTGLSPNFKEPTFFERKMTNSKANPNFNFEEFKRQNIPVGGFESKDTDLFEKEEETKLKDINKQRPNQIIIHDEEADKTPKSLLVHKEIE
jgi:hypothetical protein